jgi:hypothetical protein
MEILSNWTVDEAGQGMRYACFAGSVDTVARGQKKQKTTDGLDESMSY